MIQGGRRGAGRGVEKPACLAPGQGGRVQRPTGLQPRGLPLQWAQARVVHLGPLGPAGPTLEEELSVDGGQVGTHQALLRPSGTISPFREQRPPLHSHLPDLTAVPRWPRSQKQGKGFQKKSRFIVTKLKVTLGAMSRGEQQVGRKPAAPPRNTIADLTTQAWTGGRETGEFCVASAAATPGVCPFS